MFSSGNNWNPHLEMSQIILLSGRQFALIFVFEWRSLLLLLMGDFHFGSELEDVITSYKS